ncbi:MAG: MFS transporter [Flavobacteriaceae bacterium]|nr:MFS transporter [Flavobacteriaceae bacterium]
MLKKGDKKLIKAWAFYDWANSVYPLVITTAVFPLFYGMITGGKDATVTFFNMNWNNTVLYTYTLSFSFLIVAFISPILSSIADYTGNKKRFMQFFCFLGSFSVMLLYFFDSIDRLWVGITFSILASIGFWGSLVFYNAYLTEIAHPEQQDEVSAKGFIHGYIGSIILLVFILTMIKFPNWYGFIDHALTEGEKTPVIVFQTVFILVGLWWVGFAQYTFSKLPNNSFKRKPEKDFIFKGFKELQKVFVEIRQHKTIYIFLWSYFFISAGIQTIIVLAGKFGDEELGLPTMNLIITILLIQLVAIVGAILFSKISKKIGNIKTLKITITIWIIVCFAAYLLPGESPNVDVYFYTLGGFLGLVLGATQTLARSTYSKLIPEDTYDNATYFSFYDVTEKLAIVIGTLSFGLAMSFTKSMRTSVLVLAIFFFLGLIVISFMKKTKYVK